jgi:protocatechuate 3,4-dioxygenase beta subunit
MQTVPLRQFGRLAAAMLLLLSGGDPRNTHAAESDQLSVRVVDNDGQPVEGAIIAGWFRMHEPIQLFGFSDEQGVGSVKLPANAEHLKLLVRSDGYGLVDRSLSLDHRKDGDTVTIQLPPATRISGRLVDEQGQPVVGVRVRPYKILKFERRKSLAEAAAEAEWVGELEDAGWPVCEVLPSSEMLLPWVQTDEQGRFTIDSVAPGQLAGLFAIGERTAATTILVRTDGGPEFTLRTSRGVPDATIHTPDDFTHTVAASVPVVGMITQSDVDAPVRLATVSPWRAPGFSFYLAQRLMQVQTDIHGKYKLIGLGADSDRIYAVPPEGLPLVAVERRTKIQPGTAVLTLDMQMPPGVKVHGRVTDLNTGETVRGAVSSYVFSDNPHLKALKPTSLSIDRHSTQIQGDGRYEIFVLPGPGILALGLSSSVSQNYRRGIGWDRIDHHVYRENGNRTLFRTAPSMLTAYNETQLFEVNIPPAPGAFEFDMVVGERRTDVPLTFTRGAEGGRLPSSVYYCSATPDDPGFSLQSRGLSSSVGGSEQAVISFFEGDNARFVQAYDSDKQLAGWTRVSPDDEAAMIELKEAATVRGRVLKADGTPLADAALRTPYPHDATQKRARLPSQPDGAGYYPSTDQDGRFQFVGLAPDLPLTIELKIYNAAGNTVLDQRYLFEDLTLDAGESRDLGELVLNRLPRVNRQ